MKTRKPNYEEGTCFLVPLREGGFGRGVVSRLNGKGVVLGYFFAPRLSSANAPQFGDQIQPQHAILVGQFGDLGLLKGEWPIVGKISGWTRAQWRLPRFVRQVGPTTIASEYTDDLQLVREYNLDPTQALPKDSCKESLMGYGFVEIMLSKLLN